MNQKLKILAFTVLALLATVASANEKGRGTSVISVQKQYQNLFLQFKGVKLVMTSSCDSNTGELVTNINHVGPTFVCIAVQLKTLSDLPAIQAAISTPIKIDGALVQFTDQEPLPVRGGVLVHN